MRTKTLAMLASAAPALAAATAVPAWVFPPHEAGLRMPAAPHRLPGSTLRPAVLDDLAQAVDWYPRDHPAPPAAVLQGKGAAGACGYCHLPDGSGRPENASLAGLDAGYIIAQVRAFASGARGSAAPGYMPGHLMQLTARAINDADLRATAAYFSALPRRSFGRVVETATVVRPRGDGLTWLPDPDRRRVPLGARLVEFPDDVARFKARDPRLTYTAFAPPGSIARGMRLATGGPQPCATCHGARWQGSAIAPPLAGRSPAYLARQLVNFRAHARNEPEAAPMQAIAAGLDDRAIIALAAFMGAQAVHDQR